METLNGQLYFLQRPNIIPELNTVYTIREIGYTNPYFPDILCISLNEIINRIEWFEGSIQFEPSFRLTRFKPLITIEDDMEMFTSMLNTIKEKEPT